MVKKILFYSAVSAFLAGCAPATSLRFSPEFSRISIEGAACGVILCKDRIQIANPEEVDRCLGGGNPVEVFYSFFEERFPSTLQGMCRFSRVEMAQGNDHSALLEKSVDGNRRGVTWDLMVPAGPGPAPDGVRYLLIFRRISISGEWSPGTQGSLAVHGSSTLKQASLKATAIVTLWDVDRGKAAAYGFVSKEAGSQMTISKSTWFEMLEGMARELAVAMRLGRTY